MEDFLKRSDRPLGKAIADSKAHAQMVNAIRRDQVLQGAQGNGLGQESPARRESFVEGSGGLSAPVAEPDWRNMSADQMYAEIKKRGGVRTGREEG